MRDDEPVKSPELAELLEQTKNWSPKAKSRALEAFKQRTAGRRRVFYCANPGRACDGKPHEGYDYSHARADQWPPPPGDWAVFAMRGGRGSGKTRAGAEFTRKMTQYVGRIALIGPTNADVRSTMILGESGLEAVCAAAGEKIEYSPANRVVRFPNGAQAGIFSGEEPDRLRGPQHGFGWLDEPAHMPQIEDVWSNYILGLRLGEDPKTAVTTTPTPSDWMKTLVADPLTVSRQVSSYANLDNLAPTFKRNVLDKLAGTRRGRQEIDGEILEDVVGALWNTEIILYLPEGSEITPEMCDRIVVAIDPAGVVNKKADETGIVVVGKMGETIYVFEDRTDKYSPRGWASEALRLYDKYQANAIVAEKNYGGEMVREVIDREVEERQRNGRSDLKPRIIIVTATRGKEIRAEPIVAMYEQGNVFHSRSVGRLETEQLRWVPGVSRSPNRIDALVWGIHELAGLAGEIALASPRSAGRAPGAALAMPPRPGHRLIMPPRSGLLLPPGVNR